MRWLYDQHGLRTEPSGAITTAALLSGEVNLDGDGDLVVVLSGRNVGRGGVPRLDRLTNDGREELTTEPPRTQSGGVVRPDDCKLQSRNCKLKIGFTATLQFSICISQFAIPAFH